MRRPQPIPPGPGQESVWDYPRPPRVDPSTERVEVILGGVVIASTSRSLRVLETSHPPTYYVPLDDVMPSAVVPVPGSTWCEFKGRASYVDLVAGGTRSPRAGWTYPDPTPGFQALRGHLAIMPALVDRCTVDGEVVLPQEGSFYGGWITSRVVGPFKGGATTTGW